MTPLPDLLATIQLYHTKDTFIYIGFCGLDFFFTYISLCDSQSKQLCWRQKKMCSPILERSVVWGEVHCPKPHSQWCFWCSVHNLPYQKSVSLSTRRLAWTKGNDLETNVSPCTPANFLRPNAQEPEVGRGKEAGTTKWHLTVETSFPEDGETPTGRAGC